MLERALSFSKAEAFEANIFGNRGGNIRYARNSVSTAGANDDTTLVVQSNFGTSTGTVTANEFDDASIERAVRRSESLACSRRRIRSSCRHSAPSSMWRRARRVHAGHRGHLAGVPRPGGRVEHHPRAARTAPPPDSFRTASTGRG